MKIFKHKFLIIFLILSWVILCGLECHWSGDDDEDSGSDPVVTKTLSTTATATVDVIYTTEMDVITDDDVLFTCDLPVTPLLVEGDLVYITIDFESQDDNWVIIDVEFDQKI